MKLKSFQAAFIKSYALITGSKGLLHASLKGANIKYVHTVPPDRGITKPGLARSIVKEYANSLGMTT